MDDLSENNVDQLADELVEQLNGEGLANPTVTGHALSNLGGLASLSLDAKYDLEGMAMRLRQVSIAAPLDNVTYTFAYVDSASQFEASERMVQNAIDSFVIGAPSGLPASGVGSPAPAQATASGRVPPALISFIVVGIISALIGAGLALAIKRKA